MKRYFRILACLPVLLLPLFLSAADGNNQMLLRIPLLSQKNAEIITTALDKIEGVNKIEACYELRVMMIEYDENKMDKDVNLVDVINESGINTSAEKIFESDIPLIKAKYKVTPLYTRKIQLE
jgi:hypothetical protein